MSDPFVFYFVLSARKMFEPPNIGALSHLNHLYGANPEGINGGAGSFVVIGSEYEELSLAQKGRYLRVRSTFERKTPGTSVTAEYPALRNVIPDMVLQAERPAQASSMPSGLLYVEHQEPFSMHRFVSRQHMVYGFGMWSDTHEVFVLTNLENYDILLASVPTRTFWLQRMRAMENANITVNTERVCSRWSRWVRESKVLTHPSMRFALLESQLMPPEIFPNSSTR